VNEPLPGPPLRIAVFADFEGPHTHRWLRVFVERGHDVHGISYYPVANPPEGVTLHVLTGAGGPSRPSPEGGIEQSRPGLLARIACLAVPPSVIRLMHGRRYMKAGLRRVLDEIRPDVFQAHYVVEHGYYGSKAGYHPFVVNAWGSDLYQAPKSPLGRWIAHRVLRQADLVSCNDPELREEALKLGARFGDTIVTRLGVDEVFFEQPHLSVNMESGGAGARPVVISDRALEPLYNVDTVIQAFAAVHADLPEARLVIANDGSQRRSLESLARELHVQDAVTFVGKLSPEALRDALAGAQVYVSVPESDSLALSTMEAMAVGALPVVSDLPSQTWIEDGENGLRVPPRDAGALAAALKRALAEHDLRFRAIAVNRVRVQMEGNLTRNVLALEKHFYRLTEEHAGRA
jgi:glycosyltransferase involved in cell wall biosynthesis